MSKTWVAFTLATATIVGGTAYVVIRSRAPDLGPAGPNRDLAPDTLAVYAEFPDVAGTWAKMAKTDAWQDLSASKVGERLLAADQVKEFLAAVDQVAAQAAYPLDAKNAMKFLGRECSVGMALAPAGGPPKFLVLTKLDVAALSEDFLGGRVNLDALWGELQRRTGKCDFTVAAAEYRGQKIATATRGAVAFHAALVGDTLAVATDAALVRATIDCRLDAGAHSIGKKATFLADVKALPAGTAGFEWYDLDALYNAGDAVDAELTTLGAPPEAVAAVHALLEGTRGAHSVALSEVVPDGDLYRATWTFSKSADLFADKAAPELRSFFAGDWLVYGELRGIGAVAEAYERSALRKKLGDGEIGKWMQGVLDDPGPSVGKLVGGLGGGRAPRASGARRGRDSDARPAPETDPMQEADTAPIAAAGAVDDTLAFVDTFAVQMGRHVASEQAKALVNGETAAALDWTGAEGETPKFAWTIRLDVEGRLLALAGQAALMEAEKGRVSYEQIGARRAFAADMDGSKLYWVLAGDALVLTNDHDLVLAAARAGEAPQNGATKNVADSIASVKAGWRAFLRIDIDRLRRSMATGSENAPPLREISRLLDLENELGQLGSDAVVAAYVPDDFGSIVVVAKTTLSAPRTDEGRALRQSSSDREPLCWASLPDTTIGAVVTSLPALWIGAKSGLGAGLTDAESGFREKMGMDLEKDLMPALGRELSMAVTFRAAPPVAAGAAGPPPTLVPGIILGVEVRDAALVKKAIDRALELAEEQLRDDPSYTSTKAFVREAQGGVEIVRMEIPAEQQQQVPVRPALALHDGYLLIASDIDVLRAAVDARNGKGRRFADSALFGRATKVLARKCAQFEVVDWSRLADQVAEYAPQMGGLFASNDVKFPEFPQDGDQDEWKRRIDEYQKQLAQARAAGVPKAKAWIDSFRVIDFAGASSRLSGDVAEATMVVKFSE